MKLALLLTALCGGWAGATVAQAQTDEGPARAGLVIHMPDGQVRAMCVPLGAEEVSGEALLRRAGVSISARVTPLGMMVCGLDEMGCDHPSEPCWCSCRSLGEDCAYWAYHVRENGGWRYAPLGPSARRVRHGDVDGWAWGAGSVVAGAKPPERTWAELCGATAPERAAAAPTAARTVPAGGGSGGSRMPQTPPAATPEAGESGDAGSARGGGSEAPSEASATARAGGAGAEAGSPAETVEPTVQDVAAGPESGTAAGQAVLRDATRTPAAHGADSDPAGRRTRDSGARPRRQPRDERGGGDDGAPVAGVGREGDRDARLGGEGAVPDAARQGDYLFFGLITALLLAGAWWLRRAA